MDLINEEKKIIDEEFDQDGYNIAVNIGAMAHSSKEGALQTLYGIILSVLVGGIK